MLTFNTPSTPQGDTVHIAIAYSDDTINMAVGGVVADQGDLIDNYKPATNLLRFGMDYNTQKRWNGTISRLSYYPTRLSNDALEALTT